MIVYSKSHGEKIYHLDTCRYLSQIQQKNKGYFYTKEEALERGYRACNCCSKMGKIYRKEKTEILNFVKNNGLKVHLYNNELYIETDEASWKIVLGRKSNQLLLYHENKMPFSKCIDKEGRLVRQYH